LKEPADSANAYESFDENKNYLSSGSDFSDMPTPTSKVRESLDFSY
jgi:hypothetical protein